MIIHRKRVAKRLASGLLAGALALGGLAISGSSVSAKTPTSPTTNRIAGDDRYETATELARLVNSISDGLVIASGESPWDALSAAALTGANRPMLLVRSNSVPSSVLDFLSDYKSQLVGGADKIYVVGGTSVISDEVANAVLAAAKTPGDTVPPTLSRIAGETRYETSAAVAALTAGAADKAILVNGNSWADAVAAGAMSAQNGWPMILTEGAYSGAAKTAIDAYLALPGSVKKFVIVGGPAVMPTSLDQALVVARIAPANIERIGGADRYQTSLLVNVWLYNNDADFDGENIALVSGENYPDALTAAGWAAVAGSAGNRVHVQLTNSAGGNTHVSTLSGTLAALAKENTLLVNKNNNLWIVGGKSAVADTAKAGWIAAANTDLTTTLVCPSEGARTLTVVWSGALTNAEQARVTNAIVAPKIKKNGTAMAAGDFASAPVKVSSSTYAFVLVAVGAKDDVFTLATDVEGANFTTLSRTAVGSTCTVTDDVTRPSVSIRAVAGGNNDGSAAADQYYVVTGSEPLNANVLATAGNWTINGAVPDTNLSCVAVGSSGAVFNCNLGNGEGTVATTSATNVISLGDAGIRDLAGNFASATVSASVTADAVAPTMTGSAVCVHNTASTRTRGSLKVTDNGKRGANGNAYTLSVVNQRGLLIPTVSVDDTAKSITVTLDSGYHTIADIVTASKNALVGDALLGTWTFADDTLGNGVPTATTTPVVAIDGKSACTLTLTGSEPFIVNSGAITVNGFAAVVSNYSNLSAAAYNGSADAKYLTNTITFETTAMGSAALGFTAGTGPKDGKGNEFLGGVTFTIS